MQREGCVGPGRPRPILCRAVVVVHGSMLLLAAHDGTHVGETALVVSAKACLVASAILVGSAPLCFGLRRCLSWLGVKARGHGMVRPGPGVYQDILEPIAIHVPQ